MSENNVYRRPNHSPTQNKSLRLPHLKKLKHEENLQKLQEHDNRKWMKKRGKGRYIAFDGPQRSKLKKVFKELDKDCSGALDTDELYEPLLALGLVESRDQVRDLIKKVSTDHSGIIEFEEFLNVLKNAKDDQGENTLIKFFKDLTNGKIFSDFEEMPFQLLLSARRRELMLQSYLGKNTMTKEKGFKVLSAFATELEDVKDRQKLEKLRIKKKVEIEKLLKRQNCLKSAITPSPDQSREYSKGRKPTRLEVFNVV
jgi:centrin-2